MLFNRTRADTLLAREGVEAVVATSRENDEYITGHQNPTHMLMKASMIFAAYSPQTQPAASAAIPTLEVETFMASRSCPICIGSASSRVLPAKMLWPKLAAPDAR